VSSVRRAALAVWDFVVGDDWLVALGVAVAIALTALVADSTVAAWWVLPVAVVVLRLDSLRRAARR
jgi:hypothetical protein